MFAGKKSAQIREILISESAWEEMTCLFAPSIEKEDDHIRGGCPCPLTGRDNLLESGLHYRGKSFRYLLNIT
ncbi:hypothetical protein FVO60_08750 [Klebsiella pneumoniae subsp. pneumoniae]|nr:hypothetical protein [Klebsiella pneumoniae subsp. pneumoniae]QHG07271.1 hypothetical protein E2E32_25445 [Klebsiella pneumoniae subsp. pneumoniae]